MTLQIVEIHSLSYADWRSLWIDYVGSYAASMSEDLHQTTFARLCDPAHGIRGIAAVQDEVLGFAHFYLHPSTYNLAPSSTLEDLYVLPTARGRGIAQQLISAVTQRVRKDGAGTLNWKTRNTNSGAIALYDKIAIRTEFLSYRMALEPLEAEIAP